ncbi:MAG TPA: AHH domain-containing protein, partial [Candidatus Brocadiaceae bacterium]
MKKFISFRNMLQPGRKYSSAGTGYRYGFNGKEKDDEVKGNANQIDYGWRVYDPRIGKFLSVDPLQAEYPELTPYQFAGNTPVQAADLDGREIYHYTLFFPSDGRAPILTHLGEQTRKAQSGLFGDWIDVMKSEGFKDYEGKKITEKSIYVHVVVGEGYGIAGQQDHPSVKFNYFKELFDWQAAGFPNSETYKAEAEQRQKEVEIAVVSSVVIASQNTSTPTVTVTPQVKVSPAAITTNQATAVNGKQLTKVEMEKIKGGTSQDHHIATNKNSISNARGGPWTPRFEKFFKNAGLDINKGSENLVSVLNHKGPHPEAYHKLVHDRLTTATQGLKPNTEA